MDKESFCKLLVVSASALPRFAPNFGDRMVLEVWYKALSQYPYEELKKALLKACMNNDTFPSIAELRRTIETDGGSNFIESAQEVASRIENAISRFGGYRSEDAMNYVGEVGRKVVDMSGGWQVVCSVQTDELPSFRKRIRELSLIVLKKSLDGRGDTAPKLPSSVKDRALAIATGSINGET